MAVWGGSQQVCASCRFWSGRREVDFSASFFETLSTEGRCNGPDGSFRPLDMHEGASCNEWKPFRD